MILSGGASARMGADKGGMDWLGRRAVDRVADLARQIGASFVITVGATDYGLPFVADDPPLGGPVGGILCGADALGRAGVSRALVLAVDAPTMRPGDLAPLLGEAGPGASFAGYPLPLLLQLRALPPDARADWSVRRLVERIGVTQVACPAASARRIRGANTPDERQALLDELRAHLRDPRRPQHPS